MVALEGLLGDQQTLLDQKEEEAEAVAAQLQHETAAVREGNAKLAHAHRRIREAGEELSVARHDTEKLASTMDHVKEVELRRKEALEENAKLLRALETARRDAARQPTCAFRVLAVASW